MYYYELILEQCIALATKQNHGHMTSKDIQAYTGYQVSGVQNAIQILVKKGYFRPIVKDIFRDKFLIRELREEYWKPIPRPPLIELAKYDALCANYTALRDKFIQLEKRHDRMRALWRELIDLIRGVA